MKNRNIHSFLLTAAVVVCLMLAHYIPSTSVGKYTFRQVDILSDLTDAVVSVMSNKAEETSKESKPSTPAAKKNDGPLIPSLISDTTTIKGRPLRIAYYGDSFIEGDIMVEDVRRALQQRYGGQGVGWVDAANEATNARSAIREHHSGFTEHLAMKHETYRGDQAGIAERYYDAADGARLSLHSKEFSKNTDTWDVARLFLRTKSPVTVDVSVVGGTTEKHVVSPSPRVQMIETRGRMNNIDYTIHGSGATVFGVALESDHGVIVDNFSMRGTSGVSMTSVPAATLNDFANLRPYDIIILQYGVNAVPPRATEQQCEWYMKQMKKTIDHLQKCFPHSHIVMVSTPDRGTKQNGQVVTAPGIPMLVRHQRQLAQAEAIDFFSLFDSMGGEGSIARLREEGQAAADFIHITRSGGGKLAEGMVAFLAGKNDKNMPANATANVMDGDSKNNIDNKVGHEDKLLSLFTYNPAEPMLFTSGKFLMAMLLFSLIYVLLRNRQALRLGFVIFFSLYYYYTCSGLCVLLLCLVTISDFLLARRGVGRRWAVWVSVVMNMGLLVFFKYGTFFASLVGFDMHDSPLNMQNSALSLHSLFSLAGLSFFTFRSLSYAVDVYKGRCKPADSLLDYAFYLTFFPVLLAGPITRAKDFLPQIRRELIVSSTMFARGVFLIAVGLFKKAVISDYIGINFVDRVFDNATLFTGGEVLLAIYGYCFQIYCDFSGYSDIAIGIALLLGFHIADNFRKPFLADSMSDFWRRWHISLSTWIRDYIYIPLGGNRKGRLRAWINQLVAMTLCGLWHGANLTFVIWGAVHGLLVCIHKFFSQVLLGHDRHYHPSGWRRVVSVVLTFHVLCATWVLFRAPDLEAAGNLFTQLFTKFDITIMPQVFAAYSEVFMLVLLALVLHLVPVRCQQRMVAYISRGGFVVAVLLLVAVIWMVIQVKASDIQPFIYFQF